jgi:hypothetical protein
VELRLTQGKGDVLKATLSVDGRAETLVNDPANAARPAVPEGEWLADSGGTAPVGPQPPPDTGGKGEGRGVD